MIVAYYRVSTARQGQSGLGLEAQRAAVQAHAERTGEPIAQEFTEIESGRKANRPQLLAAICTARMLGATLVVAKLDRLSRDVRTLLTIVDGGVRTLFLDLPDVRTDDPIMGRLILTMLGAIAEFEARRIGQRIKEALSAKRARGEVIRQVPRRPQTPEEVARLSAAGHAERRRRAGEYRRSMRPIVESIRRESPGISLAAIAARLNERNYRTQKGREWTYATVDMVMRIDY